MNVWMMAAPIFIALIMRLFISNQLMIGIVAIIVAMPAAASTTMFAAKYHGDQALASACVFTSTLASVVTIPLVSAILFAFILQNGENGEIDLESVDTFLENAYNIFNERAVGQMKNDRRKISVIQNSVLSYQDRGAIFFA